MRLSAVVAAIALAAASAGCETFKPMTCDRDPEDNPEVRYTGGDAGPLAKDGVYESAPWDGELLYFPGGMRYELVHGLGQKPRWVQLYVSFDRFGTTDGGMLAPAAGNQAVVTGVDDEAIHVKNDSCVEYWLLVTAGVGAEPAP